MKQPRTAHEKNLTTVKSILNNTGAEISLHDAGKLRRLAKKLHQLDTEYANGVIQHNEDTDTWTRHHNKHTPYYRVEELKEDPRNNVFRSIGKVLKNYKGLMCYHQENPIGAPLYVYNGEQYTREEIDRIYSTHAGFVYSL